MTQGRDTSALALARAELSRSGAPFSSLPERFLLVDVARQRLTLIEGGQAVAEFPISTAAAGVGGEAGSLRTPLGWHSIHSKIGGGAPLGAVFESREDTGKRWGGESSSEDLILTRILWLDGLEPELNRGPGRDSLSRYIYVHGTNREDQLGQAASHGCVRMANADVAWLFDRVEEGDALVVVGGDRPAFPDPLGRGRFHYAGIGGSGMSALAQFQTMSGGVASGSDRSFDAGGGAELRGRLERLGIVLHPQDGSGVEGDCAALALSTAVEAEVPDFAAARRRGIPVVHRSELLAHFVDRHRAIAVAGTSGKSSVVAMIFEILRGCGRHPSVITGGELIALQQLDLVGNAYKDLASNLLVVEADESDGSLVRYHPAVGLVLNLQKDHKEMHEVAEMFARFREQSREGFVVGEDENLAAYQTNATIFGFGPDAEVRAEHLVLEPGESRFEIQGVPFRLPAPGRHNVLNALAAVAACSRVGVEIAEMAPPLASYAGVARRFQVAGEVDRIEVVDDFAHNPAKLRAAIATAQARAGRVLAIYQPHGYGPTRFLRPDLVAAFLEALRPEDRLWMLEVFYAGGSARRDFSAAELMAEIVAGGRSAAFAASRQALAAAVVEAARPGDLVLVMGARDPSLTTLARSILDALGQRSGAGARSLPRA
jgi:UDP-N-acetylmuramate--alanine ligase